jgi:2-dehydropantoate 2-reductase
MRYVVVGAGAVGGLYGARLAAAGHDVAFVARSDAEALRRNGLRVESVLGDVTLAPGEFAVATDPAALGPAEVVLVCVKTTAAPDLPALLGPLVGPGTTVAVLQNGLGVEAVADEAAPGAATVLGGLCFVCAARVGPGHVRHDDYGAVTVGLHRGDADRAAELVADLVGAGVPAEPTADLTTARWRKLLWNVPFNGLSVVLGAGTDELLDDPAGRALVVGLMEEVVAGGVACGAELADHDIDDMVARTERMVPYRPAMKLDFDAGRPLACDAIHGAPVRAAASAGVAMPRTEQLWHLLRLCSDGRRRRRAAAGS